MRKFTKFATIFLCLAMLPPLILTSMVAFADLTLTPFNITCWDAGARLFLVIWWFLSGVMALQVYLDTKAPFAQ